MKNIKIFLSVMFMLFCTASIVNADPFIINAENYPYPGGAGYGTYWWAGLETSQHEIDLIIAGITGSAPELWKQNAAPENGTQPPAEGPFADSYSTELPANSSGATIKWDVGKPYINGAPIFILVKDGEETPAWYLFGMEFEGSPLAWDGMNDIILQNFWPLKGAISHVAIYDIAPVPEPTSMVLLALGLCGLTGIRRSIKP